MKWLIIAAIVVREFDGISKKIIAETSAFAKENENAELLCLSDNGLVLHTINADNTIIKTEEISFRKGNSISHIMKCRNLACTANKIIINNYSGVYIRHMYPSFMLIRLLKKARSLRIKIVYEIPTFPYYHEQFNESKNKLKTVLRLGIETIFWPFIYYEIDTLTIIRCNSKSLHLKKMVDIKNGLSSNPVFVQQHFWDKSTGKINIVGVGTIYKYHGYDKIIEAINSENNSNIKFTFYIVGESDEIARLEELCNQKGYCNIVFCGKKYGDELERIYSIADIAVGTMSLNLRHADIDTAIKNIEYFSKGLPVITSGKIFNIPSNSGLYTLIDASLPISEELIIQAITKFQAKDRAKQLNGIVNDFTWKSIMAQITK